MGALQHTHYSIYTVHYTTLHTSRLVTRSNRGLLHRTHPTSASLCHHDSREPSGMMMTPSKSLPNHAPQHTAAASVDIAAIAAPSATSPGGQAAAGPASAGLVQQGKTTHLGYGLG